MIELNLNQFFMLLDKSPDLDITEITGITEYLQALKISIEDVQDYVKFSNTAYRRNLLHEGNGYQALIICWKNGQRSQIHNHKGSNCGVKILKGVATETIFEIAPNNLIYPTNTEWAYEGDVIGSKDDNIHQISNLQDELRDLITLHIYSPPLFRMDCYSLESTEIRTIYDPVYGSGDGI